MDCAAREGRLKVVQYLESCGAEIKSDSTSLYYAAYSDNAELVEYLLDKGVNVNTKYRRGETALHAAAGFANCKVVELLLAHGAEINAQDDDGQTPLWEAVRWHTGDGEIANLLRAHGAK